MQTVKLYDNDSHQSEFDAAVLSCEKYGENYKIILDKTLFFPEAGGQPSDTGFIDGIRITDVKEENDEIYHITEGPLKTGQAVHGVIDYARRFSFMQNHSGEHIVSGIVHRKYGFDNVSFHLNEQFATLDFNGTLTREQLDEIENEANEAVYKNLNIKTYYPTKKELEKIDFRSKKDITAALRIVEIEGVDVCACCAPHVNKTGEIGVIKLLDTSRMRGGTRIVLKCGRYAIDDYRNKFSNTAKIAALLSVKQEEAAHGVENLLKKQDDIKQQITELTKKLIEKIVLSSNASNNFFYEKYFDMKELQLLTDSLHKTYGGTKVAFSGEEDNYNFVICGEDEEVKGVFAEFKERFEARGGGRNGMNQGSVKASIDALKDFFKEKE